MPITFPIEEGQLPLIYNHHPTGRGNDYYDLSGEPLYPFGFGLSYTKFDYKNLKINKTAFAKGENVQVSVAVTNSGNYDGKEVVQLYIHDEFASIVRPIKELKGFELVNLKKGETKTVTFTLTEKELGFYDNDGNYLVEPGTFKIMVGGSSDKGLESGFEIKE